MLRLGVNRRYKPWPRRNDDTADLLSLLQATPERRRAALWQAVNRFVGAQILDHPTTNFWTLRILGFPLDLQLDDFDWLLEDAEHRPAVNERQVAASAALGLWRQGGSRPDQLARLATVGAIRPEVADSIEAWTRPRPQSEAELALEREMRRNERRSAVEWAKREQSWREFADRLRADPGQLRSLKPPSDKGVDVRLYHLWHLLDAVGSNRSRYAIDDLTPLEPMFGPEVVSALHDAFVAYWRHWAPTLRSERPDDERNTINTLDCIGIVGVTLEAARHPGWATTLSHEEAVLAAIYATLELNGFPNWFVSLAQAQPNAVREVLLRSVAPELKAGDAPKWCEMLEDVSQADVAISSLLANQLFDYLRQNEALPTSVLAPMLRILKGGYKDRAGLAHLLHERFDRATVVEEEALYLAPLFELNPTQANTALDAKLALLPAENQTLLVQSILQTLFGARWANRNVHPGGLPFETWSDLSSSLSERSGWRQTTIAPPARFTLQTRAMTRKMRGARCSRPLSILRGAAWRAQGVAVLRPEDIRDDWTRQALINEANRLYGRRPGGGR